MVSLVFRDTNLFTAAASVCGVTLEPNRPTPPSVCAPTDRTPPPVCGPPRPPTGPPLRSVGLRWALKPRSRPVHYNVTLVLRTFRAKSSVPAAHGREYSSDEDGTAPTGRRLGTPTVLTPLVPPPNVSPMNDSTSPSPRTRGGHWMGRPLARRLDSRICPPR